MDILIIEQVSKYHWRLVSKTGKLIQDCIMLNDAHQAEAYVKAYISSFQGWDYEVKTS